MEQTIETRKKKKRLTFTDQLRVIFRGILEPTAAFFNRLGIHPNTMTLLGLLGAALGAFFVAQGRFSLGGLFILIGGPFDAIDGVMARLRGEPENFGAFVDSVTDRYSELFIYAALLWHYSQAGNWAVSMLVFIAAGGSVLVSYIRAKAQTLGLDTKVGLLTRVERVLVIGPSLLFNIPLVGVGIVAVGSQFTALQRIIEVRRLSRSQKQ